MTLLLGSERRVVTRPSGFYGRLSRSNIEPEVFVGRLSSESFGWFHLTYDTIADTWYLTGNRTATKRYAMPFRLAADQDDFTSI